MLLTHTMNERTKQAKLAQQASPVSDNPKPWTWHRLPTNVGAADSSATEQPYRCRSHHIGHASAPTAATTEYVAIVHVHKDTWTVAITQARGIDERIAVVLTTSSRAVALRKLRSITKSASALLYAYVNSPRETYGHVFGSRLSSALYGACWQMQGRIIVYATARVHEGGVQ